MLRFTLGRHAFAQNQCKAVAVIEVREIVCEMYEARGEYLIALCALFMEAEQAEEDEEEEEDGDWWAAPAA